MIEDYFIRFERTTHRHKSARGMVYTEGVKYLADAVDARWLIDKIAINQRRPEIAKHVNQRWLLEVVGATATLRMQNGDLRIAHVEAIKPTDFPEPGIKLLVIRGDVCTILLPSEYCADRRCVQLQAGWWPFFNFSVTPGRMYGA